MENEEAWIAPYYAGDYLMMAENNPDLAFYLPQQQGFNLFTDAMCIPNCAREKEAAELFINFLCDPEIAAANMDWVGYSVPLSAAKEYMDPEMVEDPVSYPSEELLSHGSSYCYLHPRVTRFVESLFLEVRIGKK
jgi:spermidine/putrescine transport system substrate-binding protein